MVVIPIEADAPRDFLDDPPIGHDAVRRCHRFAAHLDLTVGIGDGAILLRPGGGGQDYISKKRGFGEENFLHHEMVESGDGLAHMMRVGIRHGRVLAHDVHAANIAGMHGIHDFNHSEATLGIERATP